MLESCRARYETELLEFQKFAKQMHFNPKVFSYFPRLDDESELKVVVTFDFTDSQLKPKGRWVFQLIYRDGISSNQNHIDVQYVDSAIQLERIPHSYGNNYISVAYSAKKQKYGTYDTLIGIFRWIVVARNSII